MTGTPSLARCGIAALAGATLVMPSTAQQDVDLNPPPAAALAAQRVPIHTAPDDPIGGPYGIWAAGASYKVSFHDDPTFVPFLGADYPRSHSLTWKTRSIRAGDVELISADDEPRRWHDEFRYEYRRGQVVEAYDVLVDGLEQTFVLHQRPAQAGDLVITGELRGTASARDLADEHRHIQFTDGEARELMRFGKATAIDASGDRRAMRTSYRGGRVSLTLDGEWLRDAEFPVTVDPLISRVDLGRSNATGFGEPIDMDVALDTRDWVTTNALLVGFVRQVSANDQDLWVYLCNRDFSNRALVFTDLSNSWQTESVDLAYVRGGSKWVVLFTRHFPNDRKAIRYQIRNSADRSPRTNISVMTAGIGQSYWRPALAGNPSGSTALIAVQFDDHPTRAFANTDSSRVFFVALNVVSDTRTSFYEEPMFANSSSFDAESPALSKVADGNWGPWMAVWQYYDNSIAGDDWDLHGKFIYNTLGSWSTIVGNWQSGLAGDTQHKLSPCVDGADGHYAIAHTTLDTAAYPGKVNLEKGTSLWVERLDYSRGIYSPTAPVEHYSTNRATVTPAEIACDFEFPTFWALGWHHEGTRSVGAYVDRIGNLGISVERQTLESSFRFGQVARAGGVAYDNANDRFALLYSQRYPPLNTNPVWPVFGTALEYPSVPAAATYGTSCGAASIGWQGKQLIGSAFEEVTLTSATPSQVAILVVSWQPANLDLTPHGLTGCRLLADLASPNHITNLFLVTNPAGSAALDVGIPDYFAPLRLHLQWFYVSPGANPINIVTTQGLRVDLL